MPRKKKKPLQRSEAAFVLSGQLKTLDRVKKEALSTNVEMTYHDNVVRNLTRLIELLKGK